ncbi:hypothetical protein H4Q26_008348 [Puccinia striiformis f. sp. tritici PST-130]|nr:hypothetical protein H4Q26_008348 [Puccinia striiformis f. sp. tritici PST-130]
MMKTKLFVPDSPTSSLSDLPSSSESEREDLLVNQPIAEPKNGDVVKRDRWIPIATSSVSKNEKHKNTRKNTRGIYLPSDLSFLSSPSSLALEKYRD